MINSHLDSIANKKLDYLLDSEELSRQWYMDPRDFKMPFAPIPGGSSHDLATEPIEEIGERVVKAPAEASPERVADTDRLAVDFDNTLTTENVEYWNDERPEPDEDVIERVNEHYHAGGTVIVWTARPWSEAGRIAAHLTEWGVRWHGIRCDKGSADVYLDDKAIRPEEVTD